MLIRHATINSLGDLNARQLLGLCLIAACAFLLAACTTLKFAAANLPARFGAYERHANLPYGAEPRQRLDAYVPNRARGLPVVVFWYGGGFVDGRREQYRFVGAALAERGVVAILPDYRTYPPSVFPDFANDAALAVRWVRDHAEEYGGDPRRIFLMGHSAGGYLASLIALDRRYLANAGASDLRLRGFIALSAPHVLTPNTPVLNRIFAAPWRAQDWQPIEFASNLAPPSLLIHGVADSLVSREQSERLAAALGARGADAELLLLPGLGHEDTVAALSLPRRNLAPVLARTLEFIQRRSAN